MPRSQVILILGTVRNLSSLNPDSVGSNPNSAMHHVSDLGNYADSLLAMGKL